MMSEKSVQNSISTTPKQPSHTLLLLENTNDISSLLCTENNHIILADEQISIVFATNIKSARKALKKNNVALLLINLGHGLGTDALALVKLIRQNLKNDILRIIACDFADSGYLANELIEEFDINAYSAINHLTTTQLHGLLASEIKTFKQFQLKTERRNAEIGLLTTLAQFSRMELTLNECLTSFNNTIGTISNALAANVLLVDEHGDINRSDQFYRDNTTSADVMSDFIKQHRKTVGNTVRQTAKEGLLQICLDKEAPELKALASALSTEVHGTVAFPIKAYDKTIAIIECFLQKQQLDNISVELITLIEKSSEQLSVMLERQQAEQKLQKQYNRLKTTLDELKNTKAQLYHSEKMASIGQLAAGLAHEINNPVSFVMNNFSPLDEYVESMSHLLKLHTKFMDCLDRNDTNSLQSIKEAIAHTSQKADIAFILDDVRSLVSESHEGLVRVKDIVKNLKEFSHADQVNTCQTNINSCIESTLKILKHQINDNVKIMTGYEQLPFVECNPGLINQVLVNLIQNSIHAVNNTANDAGEIHIKTCNAENNVKISIRDNGVGIPEDKISQIFNPFYTSKPVGEGTGLGLSISHGIIQKHNGNIEVQSQAGEFTEFVITLPTDQPEKKIA